MTYNAELAGIYDLIDQLGGWKDYAAEAVGIGQLIRDRHPTASSLLDVACGTGLHLQTFAALLTMWKAPTEPGLQLLQTSCWQSRKLAV